MVEVLPFARSNPFDPPAELGRFRAERPLRRLTFADGHMGWLVTSHRLAKAVLADARFSARAELQRPEIRLREIEEPREPEPARPGFFIRMDPPDHTRYRRLLTGQFTVRRMNQLQSRIEKIVADHLAAMEKAGPPVDLVEAFARPVPSLVICELLGVPDADREEFQRLTAVALSREIDVAEARAIQESLQNFLKRLVRHKRADQADDLLSGLISKGQLTDDELIGITLLLLIAGHETTSHMLALGTFALLNNPAQLDALCTGQASVVDAVEELLRYLTIFQRGITRTALEEVELDGESISVGECVSIALPAANRDPVQFDGKPDTLDLSRDPDGHVAFGHGIHQCLGQQLARVQMRVGYSALFRRFPTLRLAASPDEVSLRDHVAIYGVNRLPVTW